MSKAVFSLEPALELELEISETRFGLLPEDLFRLAVRQNTQRAFLFVSKVLGKHLPVEPAALLAAGKLLALAWLDQKDEQGWAGILKGSTASPFFEVWDRLEHSRYSLGMEDRALFLGFAETATGLARAVADCFDGEMAYISTTRVAPPRSPLTKPTRMPAPTGCIWTRMTRLWQLASRSSWWTTSSPRETPRCA